MLMDTTMTTKQEVCPKGGLGSSKPSSESAVLAAVQQEIAPQLTVELSAVQPHTNLAEDLGADSLDLLQVAIGLERGLQVELPDAELERITTVQQLIDCVRKHLPVTGVVA